MKLPVQRLLTIERKNPKETVFTAREFSDLQRTGNVIAESIKELDIKVSFVKSVA